MDSGAVCSSADTGASAALPMIAVAMHRISSTIVVLFISVPLMILYSLRSLLHPDNDRCHHQTDDR
jgi:hypothetical protein